MSPLPVGFKHSAQSRANMSASRKGKPHSVEHRRNLGMAIKAAWARKRPPQDEMIRRIRTKHRKRMLARYGMTESDFTAMAERQKGLCAICQQPPAHGHRLCIDHEHKTNRVRELLCRTCNLVIGNSRENPATLLAAANYVRRHKTEKVMRVYVAGKMSGVDFYNYPKFFQAKMDWITAGHDVTTPFETNSVVWQRHHGRPFNPYQDKCDYGDPLIAEMWLENMTVLTRSDAIAMLPGWETSKGAGAELLVAISLGKEVYDAVTMERLYLLPRLHFQTEMAA